MTGPAHPAWCSRDDSCTAYADVEELELVHRSRPYTVDLDDAFRLYVVLVAAPAGTPDVEITRHEVPLNAPWWLHQPATELILTINTASVMSRALARLVQQVKA